MHRILRLLTAFVFPGKYDAGILAAPKPHKAACSIVLYANFRFHGYTLFLLCELNLIPFTCLHAD